MPNTYFQSIPLEKAIDTIASSSKRFEICITYDPEWIAEDPKYNNWDVLYTSNIIGEFNRQLRNAIEYAKRYSEKYKNKDVPKFENLAETKSDFYTIFIRYQI